MQPMVNIALRAARNGGEIVHAAFNNISKVKIEDKSCNDYVTEVDKASEEAIIYTLKKSFPNHSFYAEESGYHEGKKEGKDFVWIIDPLDGTTNFIRGIAQFSISIACQYKGRIEHAVIVDPMREEEFCASRGHGATLNSKRIRVKNSKNLTGALIGTGIPFKQPGIEHLEPYLQMMRALINKHPSGIRRLGSAALDLAYVAAGRLDAFWELGLQKYDMAAGILLIEESGGLVSDLEGGHTFMETGNIVAGNRNCFKEILQSISPFVKKITHKE
jgi:myo-inositol-1(or 4)-monophosphatase